ncbi:MAG: hypothetical protein FJ012_04365 [Chloroflexi bacterium]|nr:hypothetical protein [Chloroflexota bacterium]
MLKPDDLCLCCGTIPGASFKELVEAGAAGGFHSISIRAHHYENARAAGLSDRDMRLMLEDHGLVITELDPLLQARLERMLQPTPSFRTVYQS